MNYLFKCDMEASRITLYPETFLWVNNHEGLIYNSGNFNGFRFNLIEPIKEVCNRLLLTGNLYSTSIGDEDLLNEEFREWIYMIGKTSAGYLTSMHEDKPVSFKPILKIQNDVDHFISEHDRGIGSSILHHLHELTFYVNGSMSGNDSYYKQTKFPLKNCFELDIRKVLSMINNSKNPGFSHLNLVGDVFSYDGYQEIVNLSIPTTIYLTMQDFIHHLHIINETQWADHVLFNILFDTIPDESLLSVFDASRLITLLVFSEEDYQSFASVFENFPYHQNVKIVPIFNGDNLPFFESFVFTNREDLNEIKKSKREIFMHQALNSNNFGKLIVLPDGHVYANIHDRPLGTIDHSVYSLLYKEFTERRSWLNIRDQIPCNDCIYQWLCPSPSDYEPVIGRSNLCQVNSV